MAAVKGGGVENVMLAPDVPLYGVAQKSTASGTLPREGAGSMRHWQTERKHGCPALEGSLRRCHKSDHHLYRELHVK